MDRNNRTPYFQQFNASAEYELGWDTALQIAYVGTRGVRLFRQLAINQVRIASTNQPIVNAVTGEIITANTNDNAILRAPFQGVETSLFNLNQTSAQSTYHSLQASLNHRLSHGFEVQGSYTFSKSIDDTSNAGGGALSDGSLDTSSALDTGGVWGNQLARGNNRGVSDFDRTHRLVLAYVCDLPKPSQVGGAAARILLSDWQVSGTLIAMSGLPVDILDPAAGSLYGLAGARPNWAPGANHKTATSNIPPGYFFNPFAFSLPLIEPGQPIPSAHDPMAILRWLIEDEEKGIARGEPLAARTLNHLAAQYAELGDKERAFARLEEAYQEHDPWLPMDLAAPRFDPLRSDPRFQDLLRRIGLPA